MERNTTAKKIIFFVLDMLLLMGAIASVLTIDGGKWILSNPAFYQPSEATPESPSLIPNTGTDSKTGTACLAPVQLASPDWYNTYLLLNAYNAVEKEKDPYNGTGKALNICGK